MATERLTELINGRAELMPLTVEQYHRMIETGILVSGDPFELLDGYLVRKDRSAAGEDSMTVGYEHAWAILGLTGLDAKCKKLGCHIRIQLPLSLPPHDEPEPDAAIVTGTKGAYRGRHPGAADVACVIEVADSSRARDRTTKLRIYAGVGIAQYVIVNLPDRVIEVYTQPLPGKGRYGHAVTLNPRQSVEFLTGGAKGLVVPLRDLLP